MVNPFTATVPPTPMSTTSLSPLLRNQVPSSNTATTGAFVARAVAITSPV
jgi:hypothetical protein